jgi:hypothetical protein
MFSSETGVKILSTMTETPTSASLSYPDSLGNPSSILAKSQGYRFTVRIASILIILRFGKWASLVDSLGIVALDNNRPLVNDFDDSEGIAVRTDSLGHSHADLDCWYLVHVALHR